MTLMGERVHPTTRLTREQLGRIEAIFHEALEREPADREAFLAEVCGSDFDLRAEVQQLLKSHESADDFIEPPTDSLAAPDREGAAVLPPGKRVGSFTITRVIASGGAGTVYEAVQDQPRRTVALKVLRFGRSSAGAVRRFELELEVLARLRHPAVAQIYEAGTFDNGTGSVPYFALEYIPEAKSIIAYADAARLNVRRRLELFAEVCDAVHHGHQRGVIHRDLKPFNILVDGGGQPKVIDFGIARATDSDIAVTTTETDVGQIVGTLAYMSPEQCAADPDEIDIRSDVYGLGVVLYELLCGRLPYEVKNRPITQALQVIQHELPRRPSVDRAALAGDIETIVLKALEKNRSRRYQSAGDLAADIRRFLNSQPIEARPPSWTYHLRLFTRRNRALVATGAAMLAILITSVIVSTIYAVRATHAGRREAVQRNRAERIAAFLQETLVSANPKVRQGDASVLGMLQEAASRIDVELRDQPEIEAGVRFAIGQAYNSLWLWNEAMPHLWVSMQRYRELHGPDDPRVAACLAALSEALAYTEGPAGEQVARDSLSLHVKIYGEQSPLVTDAMRDLGYALFRCAQPPRFEEAEKLLNDALTRYQGQSGDQGVEAARCKHILAAMRYFQHRFREAVDLYREILPIYRSRLGEDHLYVSECLDDFAAALHAVGRYRESEELLADAVRLAPTLLGGPWTTFSRMRRMGILQHANQQYDEAERSYRQCLAHYCLYLAADAPDGAPPLETLADELSSDQPHHAVRGHYRDVFLSAEDFVPDYGRNMFVASLMTNIADLLLDVGELPLAEQLFRNAAAIVSRGVVNGQVDYDHWLRADIQSGIGACLSGKGLHERAEPFIVRAVERIEASLGRGNWRTRLAIDRAIKLYDRWGDTAKADEFRVLRQKSIDESNRPEGIAIPSDQRPMRFPKPSPSSSGSIRVAF